jgi:hypothetical protein
LGEFGRLIVDVVFPLEQFQLLHSSFPQANPTTKGEQNALNSALAG